MTVYLCCELTARDLDARLMIASHLLKAKEQVVVGQFWAIAHNLNLIPPGAVLFATGNKWQAEAMALAKRAGHAVCFTDEEALALDEEFLANNICQEAVDLADTFFFQTKQHETAIKRAYSSVRGAVTGSARVDLLRRYKPAPKGRYVLVNTTFALLNSVWNEEMPHNWEFEQEEANFQTVKAIIQWLLSNETLPVVVRPHPAENADTWRKMGPIEVVSGSTAAEWIAGSRLAIHPGSTTGLEAALMGVPCINVGLPDSRLVIDNANFRASDVDDAITAIDSFLSGRGGPIAAFRPRLPFFPKDGAKEIARGLLKLSRKMQPSKPLTNWSPVIRTEVQARKFSADLAIFSERCRILCGQRRVTQIDDSVFVIEP